MSIVNKKERLVNKLLKRLATVALFVFTLNAEALSLNELSATLQKSPNLMANYTQDKTLNKLNKVLESSGEVVIVDNKNVFFRQNEPFELEQIITQNRFAQIMDDEVNEITKENNPQLFEISNLLLNIFSMNELNDKYFAYTLDGDLNDWSLVMEPKDELLAKIFKSIKIKGAENVKEIVIEDVSTDTTKIYFSDYKTFSSNDLDKIKLTKKEQSYLVK